MRPVGPAIAVEFWINSWFRLIPIVKYDVFDMEVEKIWRLAFSWLWFGIYFKWSEKNDA